MTKRSDGPSGLRPDTSETELMIDVWAHRYGGVEPLVEVVAVLVECSVVGWWSKRIIEVQLVGAFAVRGDVTNQALELGDRVAWMVVRPLVDSFGDPWVVVGDGVVGEVVGALRDRVDKGVGTATPVPHGDA